MLAAKDQQSPQPTEFAPFQLIGSYPLPGGVNFLPCQPVYSAASKNVESALVSIEEDEELGPRVLKLRLQGAAATQIGKELMIATHQVHKALDAVLPMVDANCRRRAIGDSLVTVDTVIAEHMNTIADPESASIVIRGVCDRRALLGVTGSSDPVQLSMQPTTQLSSTDRIRAVLDRLCTDDPQLPQDNGNSE